MANSPKLRPSREEVIVAYSEFCQELGRTAAARDIRRRSAADPEFLSLADFVWHFDDKLKKLQFAAKKRQKEVERAACISQLIEWLARLWILLYFSRREERCKRPSYLEIDAAKKNFGPMAPGYVTYWRNGSLGDFADKARIKMCAWHEIGEPLLPEELIASITETRKQRKTREQRKEELIDIYARLWLLHSIVVNDLTPDPTKIKDIQAAAKDFATPSYETFQRYFSDIADLRTRACQRILQWHSLETPQLSGARFNKFVEYVQKRKLVCS